MLILFLGLSDLGYSTQLEGGYSDFSRGGDGNLLLQFIWCLSFNHSEGDLFVVIESQAQHGIWLGK